jgi:hypothetical protein
MTAGDGYFYWDNAFVNSSASVQNCLAAMSI